MEFRQVSFKEYKDILYPLFKQSWDETYLHKDTISMCLDYDLYHKLEDMGKLIIIVAEVDNRPVGCICYILAEHPHYVNNLAAQNDTIFLLPEFRAGRNALNMLMFAEVVLADIGVDIVFINVTTKVDFSNLLEFVGYNEQETVFTKRLK